MFTYTASALGLCSSEFTSLLQYYSRLSGTKAREVKEARASGDSSRSLCSQGSPLLRSNSSSGSSSSKLPSQAGRQQCRHRRGREQLHASLGPVGGSRSPVGAAVDHIWSATAPTGVSLSFVDATSAHTRHGANVCSLCLSGDDSGEATLEEAEEKFGGVEEVPGFVNAVRAQAEVIMTAAVLQGDHTAHSAWSRLSHRLTHTPTHIAPILPGWNRLYVAKSLHLRPCHLLYEQNGTAKLVFACDYRDSNGLAQLKDSNRLRAYVPAQSHCLVTDLTDAQPQLQMDSTGQTEPTALVADRGRIVH